MGYLFHGDLHDYLASVKNLSESDTQDLTFQILEGLCFMHDNGFSHRDLKPNVYLLSIFPLCSTLLIFIKNVLIKSKPPDSWWVKLGDSGLSKRAGQGNTLSSAKGTWGYMAPELMGFIGGDHGKDFHDDKSSDIWALGVMTFRMLTGDLPFESVGAVGKYVRIMAASSAQSVLASAANMTPIGWSFVQIMLAPEPNARTTADGAFQHEWLRGYKIPGLAYGASER